MYLSNRDLEEINRAIKYAGIYKVSLSVNYISQAKAFNLEMVQPKKDGIKITRKAITNVKHELSEMIKELQAKTSDVKPV